MHSKTWYVCIYVYYSNTRQMNADSFPIGLLKSLYSWSLCVQKLLMCKSIVYLPHTLLKERKI